MEDDVWDDIEGLLREDEGEVALVNENERTGKEVEVVEELEEEAFCEYKDIDDNVELEGEVVCGEVCEKVELGIKNEGGLLRNLGGKLGLERTLEVLR